MVRNLLLVALGGGLGSVCRYLVSRMVESSFPWGTFAVNILGSLLIGLLVALVGKGIVSNEIKLLLVTGFCGGFTTFSTFANESAKEPLKTRTIMQLRKDSPAGTALTFRLRNRNK